MTDFEKWLEMNYSNMKRMQMSTLSEGLLNKAGFSVQSQSEKAKELAEFAVKVFSDIGLLVEEIPDEDSDKVERIKAAIEKKAKRFLEGEGCIEPAINESGVKRGRASAFGVILKPTDVNDSEPKPEREQSRGSATLPTPIKKEKVGEVK